MVEASLAAAFSRTSDMFACTVNYAITQLVCYLCNMHDNVSQLPLYWVRLAKILQSNTTAL